MCVCKNSHTPRKSHGEDASLLPLKHIFYLPRVLLRSLNEKNVCSLYLFILHNLYRHLYGIKLGNARKAGTVDTTVFLRDCSTYALCNTRGPGINGHTCPRSHPSVNSLHLHRSERATGRYLFISRDHIF